MMGHPFVSIQVDSDDVITKDEQIYLLIGARAKCERSIRAQLDTVRGFGPIFPTVHSFRSRGVCVCIFCSMRQTLKGTHKSNILATMLALLDTGKE